jgi:hypothetical protein
MDRHIPFHGTGRFVVAPDVAQELPFQIRDGSKYSSRDDVAVDPAEPQLDLIQPGRVGWSEVQVNLGMHCQEVRDRPALSERRRSHTLILMVSESLHMHINLTTLIKLFEAERLCHSQLH